MELPHTHTDEIPGMTREGRGYFIFFFSGKRDTRKQAPKGAVAASQNFLKVKENLMRQGWTVTTVFFLQREREKESGIKMMLMLMLK